MGLVEAQERIGARLRGGASLEQVERELINPSPFSDEQRAALWLFASAVARSVCPKRPSGRQARLSMTRPNAG
jgi:hypothetical protein